MCCILIIITEHSFSNFISDEYADNNHIDACDELISSRQTSEYFGCQNFPACIFRSIRERLGGVPANINFTKKFIIDVIR
jgi:hypothetical protein